ncbi:hypothetical protein KP79_PYT09770 [Mizuhopecten yessoensis]|uniref:Uncharacterized protein n=1 Tax=Mizuhopecten yessoensis TaxID=6573 RepID=A0A210PKR3_MIZYE|nr:hypothetical protein KP79_PYT09770 [Mizuhopecten yessoensis]
MESAYKNTPERGYYSSMASRLFMGGHRAGKVATHQCCHGGTWYVMVDENEMQKSLGVNPATDIVTCEIPYGGMLLLNNMIPHRRYTQIVVSEKTGLLTIDSFLEVGMHIKNEDEDDFDTTIQGPWMKKWEIVHVNRHVESYKEVRQADRS